ncbi:TPA: gp58-like family protein [Streptococcus suis]
MVHTVTFNQAMLAKDRVFAIRAGAYTSSDIKEASFNYGYISGDTFKPGGTVAGSAKLTFTSIITSFNKLDKVYPEIGLKVGDSFEWVAMGEYFVNDINIDRNRNTTELDLMDGMFKLNQPYISDLTYPAQIRDVIREICVKTGVELETDNLGFRAIQHHIQSKGDKKDITFREVLSQAIQLLGFSAFFNRKGKLEIRGLTDSNITITADNYFLHGLTKSELMYQIAGITCKKDKETLTVGLRTGRSLELENSFMIQNILDDLYYDLKNIRYYPYSLDWQGHLKLDVGQWITLKTNKNEVFKVPVLSQSFSFKGGLKSKISADSKAGNDTQYSYKGFLGKRIEQMSTEIEAEVQQQLEYKDKEFDEKINKAKSEINDGIEQSKAEAEAYADTIKQQIDGQLAESDRQYQLAQQAQDRQIAESLRIAGTSTNLANAARALAEQANNDLVQVKASAESQARLILEQAQRQSELINRVTTVENVVDGTKVTVTELSKTLNKATGDIDSVTSRTKTVEDNLSQTRAQYEHLTQTVNAQTGQIDSINRKTVDLQSGIDGVTQRFENLQVGGNNLLKNTKDFSGEWDYNGHRRKIAPWKYNGLSAIEADYPWEGLTQLIRVRAGEVYTFSAYVASSLASDSAEIYIHLNNYRTEQMAVVDNYYHKFNMTATFQRVSITFKVITDGYIAPRIERSDLNGILYFAGMKLERETIATDWSPSHEDATNYADAKIAEYKNTVDGRFATLQASVDNKANLVDFQRVQETARLYERILGASENEVNSNLARQVLTSSLWQTEITRLPRAGGKNYFLNSNFKEGLQFWENNTSSPDLSIDPQLASQVKRVGALHVDTGNTGAFAHGFYQIVDMPVSANEQVTVSFDVAAFPNNDAGLIIIVNNHLFDVRKEIPASEIPKTNSFGPTSLKRKAVTLTIPQDCDRLCCIIIFGPGTVGNMIFADMQIEKGGAASDHRPNPTDANRELEAVTTRVTQLAGAWAVQHLNQAGDILSQANLSSSQFLLEAAKIRLKGKTLADEIQAIDGKFNTLFVADGTFGKLNANVIDSQAITADKLKVDQAFFNKLMANNAYLKQLFAKTAFITSVQAVTMSAGQIVGGVLKATNGAAEFDLNNAKLAFNSSATIEFNSSGNALIRKVGDVTGFLHFNNAAAGGTYVGLGVTSHNEGVKSQDTGRFAGIRIFRSNDTTDQTEIYGDKIYLSHGFNGNGITITATKLSTSYELVDVINSVRALWRCWLHWNGTGWNPDDMAMRRSVINEYNTYNIG